MTFRYRIFDLCGCNIICCCFKSSDQYSVSAVDQLSECLPLFEDFDYVGTSMSDRGQKCIFLKSVFERVQKKITTPEIITK